MSKSFSSLFVAILLSFTAVSASAITYIPLDVNNPGFTYSPTPAAEILFVDENITPQNPVNIQAATETGFGLPAGSLNFVGETAVADTSSSSFISDVAFNYLAIHFGGSELFFRWTDAINSFSISDFKDVTEGADGTGGGISNFRAYSDLTPIPLPAAGWLFGSALIGLMGLRRKLH